MADPNEIRELQEALGKIETIARQGKLARQEESLVSALNDIADLTEEWLGEDEDEETGDDGEEEDEET